MNSTLEIVAFNTVPVEYTWDDGIPSQDYLQPLSAFKNGNLYTGRAPFVSVLLSSTNTSRISSVGVRRTIDFGDFHNTETNIQFYSLTGKKYFSHTYVMPGIYTITLTEEEYVTALNPLKFPPSSYFHSSSDSPNRININVPAYWHWEDYRAEPGTSSNRKKRGQPTTWKNLSFQEPLKFEFPRQLKWMDMAFCLDTPIAEIHWLWNNLLCTLQPSNENSKPVTWNEAVCGARYAKTWNDVLTGCTVDDFILSAIPESKIIKQAIIEIKETAPIAYLSASQPNYSARRSPLTVRLTPKFTQSGSFPIEKIVWDLGDGSPLLVRRRNEKRIRKPFTYTGVLTADYRDPRNFDVIHTYKTTLGSKNTFYPSITAFSSSTGTSDVAATTIGPIKLEETKPVGFVLTQNELTDNGAILLGEVDNVAVLWKTKTNS